MPRPMLIIRVCAQGMQVAMVALIAVTTLLTPVSPARADQAPGARQYHDWLTLAADRIDSQMHLISHAAHLAHAVLEQGSPIRIAGDPGLAQDLQHARFSIDLPWSDADDRQGHDLADARVAPAHGNARTGGGETQDAPTDARADLHGDVHHARRDGPRGVLLIAAGIRRWDSPDARTLLVNQLAQAEAARTRGEVVIALASMAQLIRLDQQARWLRTCDVVIDTAAPAEDGLIRRSVGRHVVPTMTVAANLAAWTWLCEVAALAHGQIDPGLAGQTYLEKFRRTWRDVGTASWDEVAQVADRCAEALIFDGRVLLLARGQAIEYHHAGQLACDAQLMQRLNHRGKSLLALRPGAGDFLLAVGQTHRPLSDDWLDEPRYLNDAGRGVAWIVAGATYRVTLPRDHLAVEQYWPMDLPAVRLDRLVDSSAAKLAAAGRSGARGENGGKDGGTDQGQTPSSSCPTSLAPTPGRPATGSRAKGVGSLASVVSEAMMWMIQAEALRRFDNHQSSIVRHAVRPRLNAAGRP